MTVTVTACSCVSVTGCYFCEIGAKMRVVCAEQFAVVLGLFLFASTPSQSQVLSNHDFIQEGSEGPKLPPYHSEAFTTLLQSQHLQFVQEDIDEWKFESTQSLQRKYLQTLWQLSHSLYENPEETSTYEHLREHLDAHCERVYNGTCEWQFSPPFNRKARAKPTKARESAAIVYLCCADAHELQDLLWSLQFLDLNFNNEYKYPVLIFHENLGPGQFNIIQQITSSNVSFHKVDFRIPPFIDERYVPRWVNGFSLGFRHMIRFFTMELYSHPAMLPYDFYWRLDSDSFLISRLWVDPFVFMRESDYKLGFVATNTENPQFLTDLWELTEAHRRAEGITSQWLSGKWNGFSFYSNCQIARRDLWTLPPVRAYLDRIDRSGGIFKTRWPDSSIHFLASALFLASQELVQLVFVPYWHHNLVILPQPWSEREGYFPDGVPRS